MEDVVKEFLVESYENLDQLDRDLVALEKDPTQRETVSRIFRTIHTIKGTCGFLGYPKLEAVAHAGESLLCRLRDGDLMLTPEIAGGLLAMVDAVRTILSGIEAARSEGETDYSALIRRLAELQKDPGTPAGRSEADAKAPPAAGAAPRAEAAGPGVADSRIRVDVETLDELMTLVGELVLVRNRLLQFTAPRRDAAFTAACQRLNLITSGLQEGIMRTRMQPIGGVWSKFPRHVRDLAASCGKKVRLEIEGAETEVDRSLLEAIRDPLTHLVRNAVDHGIETPDVRRAAGKPPEGRVRLRAFHQGGQVVIEIADDGGGIDLARVREAALDRGLILPTMAARMSDREIQNLIFLPGFSTAREVTSLSGRGVGMDVVRTNVEKAGGAIEILSTSGKGTTVSLKIPLTLAIIPALVVGCGGNRYAIPQGHLRELVRLEKESGRRGIEMFHGAPVFRLRGGLLPVVGLSGALGAEPPRAKRSADRPGPGSLLVLQADGRSFGLLVDEIGDTEEIVVKPLGRHLKDLPVFAGATILGDGQVALILDVAGLARLARVVSEASERDMVRAAAAAPDGGPQTLLVFGVPGGGRMALPLSSVARLEEFPPGAVERAGGRDVVQYRSGILPLVRVSDLFGGEADPSGPGREPLKVVVHSEGGRTVGLVVGRIHDIVTEPVRIRWSSGRRGVLGTAVIQRRVTEVLDLPGALRGADLGVFEPGEAMEARA